MMAAELLVGLGTACALVAAAAAARPSLVPALFVFGDSLIDNGNNNNLASLAKANYFPYGIDFATGPTGRFSNGYTIVDELVITMSDAICISTDYLFPGAKGSVLRLYKYVDCTVQYTSTIRSNCKVGRIPFNQQIQNFETTVEQIAGAVGPEAAAAMVARSILFVGLGSNDYLNNYLMPNYNTRRQYNPRQFADLLAQQYAAQLTRLYNAGARKFVVAGVGSMGCIPSVLAQSLESRCSPEVDELVLPFNANVRAMLDGLNAGLPGARLVYLDNYAVFKAIHADPAAYGFSVVDRGCCGIGRNSGQVTCLPFMPPCDDRQRYVFWDAFHPTAAVNVLIARQAFDGGADVVSPINVRRLASL
ncbi:hypothetical protein ABZP36_029843 [Zizania latifolia]